MKRCKNCDSPHLYYFRLDSDWGTGGDYSPINAGSPQKDRPDIETTVCDQCGAVGDDVSIEAQSNPEGQPK